MDGLPVIEGVTPTACQGASRQASCGQPQPARGHSPGSGYEWAFTFGRDGIESGLVGDRWHVCGPIEPGRDRFVYWGIAPVTASENGVDHDLVLGTEFDVVQSRADGA